MIEVRPAPPEHYPWIAARAGIVINPDFRAIEAVQGETIAGMVGYDGWTPNSCCMHVAIDNPICIRRMIHAAFETPVKLGRDVLLAPLLSTNEKSIKFVTKLGFRPLVTIRDGWSKGVDLRIFQMRRENCRWVRENGTR